MKQVHVSTIFLCLVATAFLTTAACSNRARLTRTHGDATREALQRQAANPNAGAQKRAVAGLDSQDAAAVATRYRTNMGAAASGGSADKGGVVVVNPQAGAAAYVPPPSVPPSVSTVPSSQ